jgi:hypothetical protein
MAVYETRLVDEDVVYCNERDVFTHIRNKKYADLPDDGSALQTGGLTKRDVDRLIVRMSGKVDDYTKRAWRTRKVVDVEADVKFSHKQKHARHRRRRNRSRTQYGVEPSARAMVDLPHNHIKPIDPAEGDKVVVLNERSTQDVTNEEGRDEGKYVVSNRKGIVRPDVRLFTPVSTISAGQDLRNGSVSLRVSYRYGYPNDVTDYDTGTDGVSDYVPEGVRDATALWVVSRLIAGDQYGEVLPNSGDDSPDLSSAASQFKDEAVGILKNFRRA